MRRWYHSFPKCDTMELMWYPELILAAGFFLFLRYLKTSKSSLTNWPFIGMLPSLLLNLHRVHDWAIDLLSRNGCTFLFKGPWFSNMSDMLLSSDPANMRYIFNTNFSNYPKGSEFKEFFDVLGDGIFNADLDLWKTQRQVAYQLIHQPMFQAFLEKTTCDKVKNSLIPVLEHFLEKNMVVDLQDVFKRFTFDTTTILLSGIDPSCLSVEFNKFPYLYALDDAEEAVFYRHVLPVNWWKLQRLLRLGKEKSLAEAKECLDQFIAQCISRKREVQGNTVRGFDLLTSYIDMEEDEVFGPKSDMFLRDTIMNFMVAGRSTVSVALTWFFYLVIKNPVVQTKIIEELKSKAISPKREGMKFMLFDTEKLTRLAYLHGAICETLRLFPSVPFEHKRPLHPDILPSGHRVDSKTKILPLIYAMGKMEEVWGKDCSEFKPERWISEKGGINYVPSYKFMAFNSGPRTCIGKEVAFTQMKMVAASLIYNYIFEPVSEHFISPKNSIIYYMKNGMKVRIKRRF